MAGLRHLNLPSDHEYSKAAASPSSLYSDVDLTRVFEDESMPLDDVHEETFLSLFPELA